MLELATRELTAAGWAERSQPRWPASSTPTGRASWRCSSSRSRPRAGPLCARRRNRFAPLTCGSPRWAPGPPARSDPAADAPIIVSTVTGLMFDQLAAPGPEFEREVLRPALERLFERLVAGTPQPA